MLLAEAYNYHRGPLLASLQAVYQLRLRDRPLSELAELVAWLPPGCPLWRSMGGPLAWSEETHLLNIVEYRLRVLSWQKTKDAETGKNRPKPPEAPPYAVDRCNAEDDHAAKQAAAHRRRQNRPT